jgi:hypothetical protein
MEAVQLLRSKGGAQSTPSGKKGYNRKQVKDQLRKEQQNG